MTCRLIIQKSFSDYTSTWKGCLSPWLADVTPTVVERFLDRLFWKIINQAQKDHESIQQFWSYRLSQKLCTFLQNAAVWLNFRKCQWNFHTYTAFGYFQKLYAMKVIICKTLCRVTALDFQNDCLFIFKIFSISLIITWCKKFQDSRNVALNYPKLKFLNRVCTEMTKLISYLDLMLIQCIVAFKNGTWTLGCMIQFARKIWAILFLHDCIWNQLLN